jgi:uncharacterized membrane protein
MKNSKTWRAQQSERSVRAGSCLIPLHLCALALFLTCREGSAEVRYRIVQLVTNEQVGAISSSPWAGGINRFGDVAGYFEIDRGTDSVNYPYPYEQRPFFYNNSKGMFPLVETNTPFSGFSSGINDNGQVAFWGTPDNLHSWAYRYTPGVGVEWLGSFGDGAGDVANAINNRGDIVGRSDVWDGIHGWQFAFLYTEATGIMQLEGPFKNFEGNAVDINDLGHIAVNAYGSVFLYTPETGMSLVGEGVPYAINNEDVVVGLAGDEDGWYHAAIYRDGVTRLLTPKGMDAMALGVNDQNVVVGQRSTQGEPLRMFIWTERDGLIWLDEFMEPSMGVIWPSGINEKGQIAGEGYEVPYSGGSFAARLDPVPPKLGINHSPTNLVVSWSPAWPGLSLEATESLSRPNWQTVDTGGTNVVAMPATTSMRFFRLNLEGIRGLCCAPE